VIAAVESEHRSDDRSGVLLFPTAVEAAILDGFWRWTF
jgi:hypothetical protein